MRLHLPWKPSSLTVSIPFLLNKVKFVWLILFHDSFLLSRKTPRYFMVVSLALSFSLSSLSSLESRTTWHSRCSKFKSVMLFGARFHNQKYLQRLDSNLYLWLNAAELLFLKLGTRAVASTVCSWDSGLVCFNRLCLWFEVWNLWILVWSLKSIAHQSKKESLIFSMSGWSPHFSLHDFPLRANTGSPLSE